MQSQNLRQSTHVTAAAETDANQIEMDIPVVDLKTYIDGSANPEQISEEAMAECKKVTEILHKYGMLLIRDPRVDMKDNNEYLDMMEEYFEQAGERFYKGEENKDIKKECDYQVGCLPERIEIARDYTDLRAGLDLAPEDQPISPMKPVLDAHWRFSWQIGERLESDPFLHPQVIPDGFPGWREKMDTWGNKLNQSSLTVAEMAAIGLGIQKDAFSGRMKSGLHLLGPTGLDLEKYDVGAIVAGMHVDICLLTVHGKPRYPGLLIWSRDWKKQPVRIPDGCLLVQSGRTFEHVTGGYIPAGFHEVIYTEATKAAFEKKKSELAAQGINRNLWRVSSTTLNHFRGSMSVAPLKELQHLYKEVDEEKYPDFTAYDLLMRELKATGMKVDDGEQSK